ncbi:type IV pilus assembly protein PilM [Patescibacteria group bacterium]|nr:type IV pilus assembly protein PilM [Patescibacteria group bacterium]MBU1877025.1 type IV pilus assembly protein PilM [Patescibacteria group bacterium]
MKVDFDFTKIFDFVAKTKEELASFLSFRITSKKCLGIDIGTSSIRIIELSRQGERKKLENYGEMQASCIYKDSFRTFDKNTLLFSNQNVAKAIKAIIEESKMTSHKAIFSIPDFSSFFTNFELPVMTEEELPQAIKYEAKRHIPLPLAEVTLDWQVINNQSVGGNQTSKILLVAVPNEIINQYRNIAQMAGLELFALEAEVFGLLRSLIQTTKDTIALVDIGAQTSTCSIIDKGVLKNSHSFDLSGNELTDIISKSLSVDYETADRLKEKNGLLFDQPVGLHQEKQIRDILLPFIDAILKEIDKICKDFYKVEKRSVKKIVLAGASALLPGLEEYCRNYFKGEVEIVDPFYNIFYPPVLEKKMKKMGPAYAIAVGMALRGLD